MKNIKFLLFIPTLVVLCGIFTACPPPGFTPTPNFCDTCDTDSACKFRSMKLYLTKGGNGWPCDFPPDPLMCGSYNIKYSVLIGPNSSSNGQNRTLCTKTVPSSQIVTVSGGTPYIIIKIPTTEHSKIRATIQDPCCRTCCALACPSCTKTTWEKSVWEYDGSFQSGSRKEETAIFNVVNCIGC